MVMSSGRVIASHGHQPGQVDATLEFLKRTRSELRMLRKVRVYRDRLHVVDVNGDWFEVLGLGYPDTEVEAALRAVNAAFNRETIHNDVSDDFKELNAGRRYAWAADRVM
jgi:hypothetical protein